MSLHAERVGEAAPPPVSRPSPGRRSALILTGCFVVGLALFWLPLRGISLTAMSGYGLISVLPIATLLGAVVLVVTFFLTLGLSRPHRVLLGVQLVALVFMLHGLGPAVEELARPPTAWQHLGFVEYITRTGEPHVALDARYSWPAFFAMVGFITEAAGIDDLEPLMHWSSVGLELGYLVAFYLILRVMWANWRAKWFAAWLLVAADWVGQDYFAPQGFAFLLYLLFLGILLNWFMPVGEQETWRPRRGLLSPLSAGLMTPGERQVGRPAHREQTVVLLVLLMVFLLAVASHQLTPYLMLFAATGLVLVNRSTLRGLPILLGVVIAAWVSYMAKAYWEQQTDDLFSGLGNLLDTLGASVGGRVSKTSPELALIQQIRILIAVLVVSLAFAGLYRRRRWRFDDRVAMVLLFVPFLAIGLQNYGGEITLRVYFFVLPGACLLVAYLFFPTAFTIARPVRALTAATLCGLLIAGLFMFVRFGNENFEQIRPGEVQAFETMLRNSPKGRVNLVWLNGLKGPIGGFPQAPWGLKAQERWDYTEVQAPAKPEDLKPIVDALKQQPGGYFLTTRGNEAYNHYNFGLSQDYSGRMLKALKASAELRPVMSNKDADVFVLRTPPAGPPPPVVPPTRFNIGKTTWTQVGILATVLLVLILTAREIARIHGAVGRRREQEEHPVLRGLGLATWPLLALCIFVIFERFQSLGS